MLPSEQLFPWRTPRLRLLANGVAVSGAIEAEVLSNSYYGADRFCATVATDADPAFGVPFWASRADITIEVQVSLSVAAFSSLIVGPVDTVVLDQIAGTVTLHGRDFTGALIETRTQETFANRTASEIAMILAQRHGLTSQVAPTTTPVGRYYESEHDRITLDQFSRATTEWDLLVFLAQHEGFDVFVQASTLYFQPAKTQPDPGLVIQPTDLIDLRLERALTLARDIEVVVKSWNSKQSSAFTQTARAARQGGSSGNAGGLGRSGPPQRYVFVRPNLTPDDALKFAQQKLAELTRHEKVIEATMPGELSIAPHGMVLLDGTGTEFDQAYFVDTLERTIRMDGGFTQRLRAKNTSPRSVTTAPTDIVGAVTG